ICPDNEEYRFCEPCNRTCTSPNPICPAQCAKGCFCKGDLLRDSDGRCVQWGQCSNVLAKNKKKEVYRCEKCSRSCGDLAPVCGSECRTGCFCKEGLVKGPGGRCIKEDKCPGS
ncbi:Zonadhesin, partial [Operophtera brumata]